MNLAALLRLADENRRLQRDLAEYKAKYEDMCVAYYEARGELDAYGDQPNYRAAIVRLDAAVTREADLAHHLELAQLDNADLERAVAELEKTVAAMTAGLSWFAEKEGTT